ncbi:MAG TPA: hypothetical protein VIV15_06055 [Anaerolineales bacterium]
MEKNHGQTLDRSAAALIGWLLVFGVRERGWMEQARQSGASMWA